MHLSMASGRPARCKEPPSIFVLLSRPLAVVWCACLSLLLFRSACSTVRRIGAPRGVSLPTLVFPTLMRFANVAALIQPMLDPQCQMAGGGRISAVPLKPTPSVTLASRRLLCCRPGEDRDRDEPSASEPPADAPHRPRGHNRGGFADGDDRGVRGFREGPRLRPTTPQPASCRQRPVDVQAGCLRAASRFATFPARMGAFTSCPCPRPPCWRPPPAS